MITSIHPRERLIQTAARLVHQQGWNATGINQILQEAEIPKGSFYYYFRSKEALGAAVLQLHQSWIREITSNTLINPNLSPGAAFDAFFQETEKMLREGGYRFGCPIGSFANEVAATSPMLATEARSAFNILEQAWTDFVVRGQSEKSVDATLDPQETAKTAVMLYQGALMHTKYTADSTPLQLARNNLCATLFGKARALHMKIETSQISSLAS